LKLSNNQSAPRIIVALDFAEINPAEHLVAQLDANLCALKVGKEMFTRFGPQWVERLVEKGFKVFLDLKFHDIPNTVAKACLAAADLGVWMVNVHASGGPNMITAAAEALAQKKQRPILTAVTVLTSMDEAQFNAIGYQRSLRQQVLHLAQMAQQNGADGVVCSAHEAQQLRKTCGDDFCLVTPGIRPAGSAQDDQSRIMTPLQALQSGASYLVVGRPITKASDPLQALCDISESIASV